jgi:FG-GAP-like repeat
MNKEKRQKWTTRGFDEFSRGKFGNGGQNIYASKQGVLQRIHQTDVTGNGYVDLVFCNSQNHEEKVPLDVYSDPINNPERNNQLYIGGSFSGCVADLNGNGYEDLIVSCVWDGMTQITNSAIFYGSDEGLNNKYVNYLPTEKAKCVTAGDFTGNGKQDLVFFHDANIKIFYQGDNGFEPEKVVAHEFKKIVNTTTIAATAADSGDTLLMRTKDGSYSIMKSSSAGLDFASEQLLLPADKDYVELPKGKGSYLQAVEEPEPLAQMLKIGDTLYLCAFRKKQTLFYPYKDQNLGTPLVFNCENAFAADAGDIKVSGNIDLVFACRDTSTGSECSWLYPGSNQGWQENNRIAIKSYNACDARLADLTGNGQLDIVICQGHTHESYTSETLLFAIDETSDLNKLKPQSLTSHDAYRIFMVNGQLVVNNCRSGSLIGDADVNVYVGGSDGFHLERKIDLPAWGCTDMVCCDLNDDGLPDLVLANAAELSPWLDPGSFVYYNSPAGLAQTPDLKLPTTRAHGVVCGDLNHNGFLDLVFCGFDNNILKIFYGSEAGFKLEDSVEIVMGKNGKIYKEPRFMALADLNGNGWLDLVVPIIDEFESFVLWGGPDGFSFNNKQVFHVRHSCNAKVADLNGNGYPDLIFGGHSQSLSGAHDAFVYIYWGGADGFSEDRRTLLPSNAVNSLAVADFNNNGLLDIFVASYQDGRLRDIDSHIYWNQGQEGFLPHKRLPMRTHAVSGNLAADFNGNGWIDLAIGNHKVEGEHLSYSTVWHNGPDGFDEKRVTNLPSEGIHGIGNVDPGNIMDRSAHEYYVSEIYSDNENTAINKFYCEGVIPEKSSVAMQFRYGETEAALLSSPWRGATGLNSWFNQHQRVNNNMFKGKFLQYKLRLSSFNALNTPRITAVIIETIKN